MDSLQQIKSFLVVTIVCLSLGSAQAAPTLDLTTPGASGFINEAYFVQGGDGSSGTGAIYSFVRLDTNKAVEQGYNTDHRPLEFDENKSPTFTRSLLLTDVPVVDQGGIDYREFRLDINQKKSGSDALLSLDTMEIYLASAGGLTGYPALGTKIFDLDATADHWILLNGELVAGSGGGEDMLAYIPNSLFVGGTYVYLYSKFGASENSAYPNNDGFEEWSTLKGTTSVVPAPSALLLVLIGSPLATRLRRQRRA